MKTLERQLTMMNSMDSQLVQANLTYNTLASSQMKQMNVSSMKSLQDSRSSGFYYNMTLNNQNTSQPISQQPVQSQEPQQYISYN